MLDTERLRMRRLMLRISQHQLATMIGQEQGYISRLEHGKVVRISILTLERLADALGVSTDYLLGRGKEEPERVPAVAS